VAAARTERLREIMAELVNRAAVVVQHFGGTVGSFTGDSMMAVFGAPTALEHHAIRACLAALAIQEEAKRLAVDVRERDGVELLWRVGLNSGLVTQLSFLRQPCGSSFRVIVCAEAARRPRQTPCIRTTST